MNAFFRPMPGFFFSRLRPVLTLLIGLTGWLACRPEAIDAGYGPDFEPRVLAVYIPGIPPDSIRIDNATNRILVGLPPTLNTTTLRPTFTLTPLTHVDSAASTLTGNSAWTDLKTKRIRIVTNRNREKTYQVIARPGGNLYFGPLSGPQQYSLEQTPVDLCFPVYNFRDSLAAGTLLLTPANGGLAIQITQYPTTSSPCDPVPRTDGAVLFSIRVYAGRIVPGTYTVSLQKENGRQAVLAQSITFTKGQLILSPIYQPLVLDNQYGLLEGENLYSGSNLSLLLRSPAGDSRPVALTRFDVYGTYAVFALPPDLTPGYYYAQLLQNNQPTASVIRLVVIATSDQPFVRTIYPYLTDGTDLLTPTADFSTPIVLTHGPKYAFGTSASGATYANVQTRLKFISVTNPAEQYVISPTTDSYYVFQLPATLPAGRYRLIFEQGPPNQPLVDAQPLERDVVVQ